MTTPTIPTTTPTVAEIFETMSYGPAPESAAPAQTWLDAHAPHLRLFIGNEWRDPVRRRVFPQRQSRPTHSR